MRIVSVRARSLRAIVASCLSVGSVNPEACELGSHDRKRSLRDRYSPDNADRATAITAAREAVSSFFRDVSG